jgi:hypothetical protein
MSNLENETNEVNETNEELETEVEFEDNDESNYSELTEDDYFAMKERLKKAENKIVDFKKNAKKTYETSN